MSCFYQKKALIKAKGKFMLDQLRAMGVFACVVEKSSFSGAARELGITTSAVSQQIRSLEHEMEVTLLYRSTRKLSLTEAGKAFFHSCQEMLAAAERGKIRINELKDDLTGELNLLTSAELGANHIIPALSHWMSAHRGLSINVRTECQKLPLNQEIDIALNMAIKPIEKPNTTVISLARVEQVLVAAPSYLNQTTSILHPHDLQQHDLIPTASDQSQVAFKHSLTGEHVELDSNSRFTTNNPMIAKVLCLQGHGIAMMSYLDVQKDLLSGALVEILPEWKLPSFALYALTPKYEQRPVKISRCLEALKQYFFQLPGGRIYQEAA